MAARNIKTTGQGYLLNALSDVPDLRDWPYEPSLGQLRRYLRAPSGLTILDQKTEASCTGFALAAIINLLNRQRNSKTRVSPRMLYEMAKRHDEWPGEDEAGSSCRGAIKGWYNMGVCRDSLWPYKAHEAGALTVKRAKDARNNTIAAYYRIQPRISDFHSALNEAGAVYCSARTHAGWQKADPESGLIPFEEQNDGGHAFAIVGYNREGFWIQNSWSEGWGKKGLALWPYEDWHRNLMDAWVFSLALPTPQIWHLPDVGEKNRSAAQAKASPPRSEIAGHFVHVDDGRFHRQGRYWSNAEDVRTTAKAVAAKTDEYQHLLLYAHGGLNSPKDSATRIAALQQTFKDNGIYPYHFMYDTGIMEELKDVIYRRKQKTEERAGGVSDWTDKILEWATRIPGRALWREMKAGAKLPFQPTGAGHETLQIFLQELAARADAKLSVHLVGHSTGAILLAHLLQALQTIAPQLRIGSCSLLAPACSVDLFHSHYLPHLGGDKNQFGIDKMQVFNLIDKLEQDDQVGQVYRKSLLYLVSRAFEENLPEKILGMQQYSAPLLKQAKVKALGKKFGVCYSDGLSGKITRSRTHGGFDNDVASMNSVLQFILGKKPASPFNRETLNY
ncbi:MAG: C1 family peptidase [gamma proteobacterium symbiont of Bathyaustriella thionipta]|nr:C1 family peptidase [gamma proteobacterium symbiont of Bathyaustriella thionipta]